MLRVNAAKFACNRDANTSVSGGGKCMVESLRRGIIVGALAALVAMPGGAALALDKVRLGKAVPNSFAFGATEVGIEAKIFEQEGLEIEVTSLRGDAQLQQALAAGSIDVG